MFTSSFLRSLRWKALRKRCWFKALDNFERGFYNLTCAVVDRVESPVLGKQILSFVVKLRDALKGEFVRLVESLGVSRAWAASRLAVSWGYRGARIWRNDESFSRFQAVLEFHSPSGWGS